MNKTNHISCSGGLSTIGNSWEELGSEMVWSAFNQEWSSMFKMGSPGQAKDGAGKAVVIYYGHPLVD